MCSVFFLIIRRPPRLMRTVHSRTLHYALPISPSPRQRVVAGDLVGAQPVLGPVAPHDAVGDAAPGQLPMQPVGGGAAVAIDRQVVALDKIAGQRDLLDVGGWRHERLELQRHPAPDRSEEHTYELQSLMRISYVVCCWTKKKINNLFVL